MANITFIRKGLDINLSGKSPLEKPKEIKSRHYAIYPDNFYGVTPKVVVTPGEKILAGSPVFIDKNRTDLQIVSPVSGTIVAVHRGERRKVLSIEIEADTTNDYLVFDTRSPAEMDAQEITQLLLKSGLWIFIKQRPYDVIALPGKPNNIFISTFDTAPLAPDFEFIIEGQENDFRTGLTALQKLTSGKIHLGIRENSKFDAFKDIAQINIFEGPHPTGNVGIQIHHTQPINKGETVWTISPADVLIIGRLFNTGKTDFTRTIPVCGSEVKHPYYAKLLPGTQIKEIVMPVADTTDNLRYISGNVLTGIKSSPSEFLSYYANQLTVIKEGDDTHEFLGWAMPRPHRFSASHTYFDWVSRLFNKNKEYNLDARILGGERNIIMSGEYDKVFPMDILPEFLIKATLAFDVDKMENLGIYEVAPEDFALCEFVDSSKLKIQQIIREGLDYMMKEFH